MNYKDRARLALNELAAAPDDSINTLVRHFYAVDEEVISGVPHNAVCYFNDGDNLCAVFGDFRNFQESPAGFGATTEEALANLKEDLQKWKETELGK